MPAHAAVWPARLPAKITPPATSLWMNLAISAMRYPDKAALVFMGRVWSFSELMTAIGMLAEAMESVPASALAMMGRGAVAMRRVFPAPERPWTQTLIP